MTSARQAEANRANARASSGPKTAKGKASSARNALRHGLSLSALSQPDLAPQVESVARRIAGCSDPEILAASRRIAVAQIDLQRVRAHRRRRIEQAVAAVDASEQDKTLALSMRWLSRRPGLGVPNWATELTQPPMGRSEKLAQVLGDLARELEALERYERLALSRRKFAIRAFDAARCARVETESDGHGASRSTSGA